MGSDSWMVAPIIVGLLAGVVLMIATGSWWWLAIGVLVAVIASAALRAFSASAKR